MHIATAALGVILACLMQSTSAFIAPKGPFGRLIAPLQLSSLFKSSNMPSKEAERMKEELITVMKALKKNGKDTPAAERESIASALESIEKLNPTVRPARSDRMNGFWR
jgi:Skp family chaperone for outer membrane proteins